MGSLRRSIRLRIYLLVAIPLVTMVGLFAFVAVTTINNAINLDRTPSLIEKTSIPAAQFVDFLQRERTAAVVYLSSPSAANLRQYQSAAKATDQAKPAFITAMTSPATKGAQTADEADQITSIVNGLGLLPEMRGAVQAKAVAPLQAFAQYTKGIMAEPKLFLTEAASLTNAKAVMQSTGLIETVQAREDLEEEDALLSGMLAAGADNRGQLTASRIKFTQLAGQRQAELQAAALVLDSDGLNAYSSSVNRTAPGALQDQLSQIETAVQAAGPGGKLPVTLQQWRSLSTTLEKAYFNGGVATARQQLAMDHRITHAAEVTVAESAGTGLAGLLLTLLFTSLVGRGIIRRLRALRRSAQTLADTQLPSVVNRLRRGESVDVAAEAPPMSVGRDEIGQVGQAFDSVRQTAIRAAVEESRLRQGLNDVFRNLARRNQSLLHRQLTVLDAMERRATDPEALDDLFRLDHLTTRMRRHAEGLIILSGAPPGRGWSSPVKLIDVMRGAVAEVEDYARVQVVSQSTASLSGSAVTDVIHLLAELIENATTLSPPYTQVRVSGEMVGTGFAVEIEDRGLGMSPQRIAELNERLTNPPEFNPATSEQLGLFVVGQLAKRHGIGVQLRPSPYGGTTAVVLIPRHLVVTEEMLAPGSPPPAALTGGQNGPVGPGPGQVGQGPPRRRPIPLNQGSAGQGPASQGPAPVSPGPAPFSAGLAPFDTERAPVNGVPAPFDAGPAPVAGGPPPFDTGIAPGNGGSPAFGTGPRPFDAVPPMGNGGPALVNGGPPPFGTRPVPGDAGPAPFDTGGPAPVNGGPPAFDAGPVPGNGGTAPASQGPLPDWQHVPPRDGGEPLAEADAGAQGGAGAFRENPFDAFAPARRSPQEPGNGAPPPPAPPANGATITQPPAEPAPGLAQGDGPGRGEPDAENGLPRRIRQASLAPQLRGSGPAPGAPSEPAISPAAPPTLEELRATMSAMQRGWQQGRSAIAAERQDQEVTDTDGA